VEFHLYLPQMRLRPEQLVERARAAEAAGFDGIAGMDHLVPPGAADQPMLSAMPATVWLAAHTETMRVGSLVLCDAFRHPSVLAQECSTIDHLSGGRFELGIGWGSQPWEIDAFGMAPVEPRLRLRRFAETIDILNALWSGEVVDYDGEFFQLHGVRQAPVPLGHIPLTIGGAGPKTMKLVAAHADWWNIHVAILDRLDAMRDRAGSARISIEHLVSFVHDESQRDDATAQAMRRFGGMGPLAIGNAAELVDFFGTLRDRNIERVYVWFTDFAQPETLAAFSESVIAQLH